MTIFKELWQVLLNFLKNASQFFIFGFAETALNFSALFPCLFLALYDALYMPLLFSVTSDGFSLLGAT